MLAASSAMICVGVVGAIPSLQTWVWSPATESEGAPPAQPNARTPEQAAELFLDAWRKRDHARARTLSTGTAAEQVEARQARDERIPPEQRRTSQALWNRLAKEKLSLRIRESQDLPGGKIALRGAAVGRFAGQPYRRQVEFLLRPYESTWRVEDVDFGTILSDFD